MMVGRAQEYLATVRPGRAEARRRGIAANAVPELIELRSGAARVALAPAIGGAIALYEWNGDAVLRATPADDCGQRIGARLRLLSAASLFQSHRPRDAALGRRDLSVSALPGRASRTRSTATAGSGRGCCVIARRRRRRSNSSTTRPASARVSGRFRTARSRPSSCPTMRWRCVSRSPTPATARFPAASAGIRSFRATPTTELAFTARGVWQTDATRLPTRFDPAPADWNFTAPRPLGATTLDNCFAGWSGRATHSLARPRRSASLSPPKPATTSSSSFPREGTFSPSNRSPI